MDLETIKALDRLSSAIEHLSASIANQLYGERSLSATLTAAQQSVPSDGANAPRIVKVLNQETGLLEDMAIP